MSVREAILLVSVLVIATCGLSYELVAGTLASYVLGDSVTQFSLVIGTYLFAMGIGSYLSQLVPGHRLCATFVAVEVLVGAIGGVSAAALFASFAYLGSLRPLLFGLTTVTGILVGLEIPLVLQVLRDRYGFKELIARVLFLDYVGALAASLLFPFVLMPALGLVRTSFVFGLANVGVAVFSTWLFRAELRRPGLLFAATALALAGLGAGMVFADAIRGACEERLFEAKVVLARDSRHQAIRVTDRRGDLRLYLNGTLQFSSRDEHRYHEALVHPALSLHEAPRRVLVLGGGDGLAVREVLKHAPVERVRLVDLDPAMTGTFASVQALAALSGGALLSPRVAIANEDAMAFLEETDERFDVAIVDLPDPSNYSLGKLYTVTFYRLLARRLEPGGLLVTQATSPSFAPRSFSCIVNTVRSAGFAVRPYHAHVPSFGDWGFVLAGASLGPAGPPIRLREGLGLRFLDDATAASLFRFPPDMPLLDTPANRLDDQILVHYHNDEWARWE